MRRKKRKDPGYGVSLFPFLAVLICTLGVLILMLVMAAKSADVKSERAQAELDSSLEDQLQEVQNELEFAQVQINDLNEVRPETVARVKESRERRSHLQSEIRELKRKFKDLQAEWLQLQNPIDLPDLKEFKFSQNDAEQRIDELQDAIALAENQLQQKRKLAAQQVRPQTQIIPYHGNSGTMRVPIFIECTKDNVILQPTGIVLKKSDFRPPLLPGNMIDSSLLAIREYFRKYNLAEENQQPYPLIVVRPDGAETFMLVRAAMKSWDDEFGYELVPEDVEVDFGKKDPQLKQELERVVAESKRRQNRAALASRQSPGNAARYSVARASRFDTPDSRPGLTASDPRGGFVSSQNEMLGSASALTRYDDSSGTRDSQFTDSPFRPGAESTDRKDHLAGEQVSKNGPRGESGTSNFRGSADSLANERGVGWALPSRTPGATGYVRPIRITLQKNQLNIHRADRAPTIITISGATEDAVDPLVNEVWKRIDSWGLAGSDGYWKPVLRFTVEPGAQSRYDELRTLLDQSGFGWEVNE